ncbi:hypothetical protein [Bradyrhizobium liaoningense]
MVANFKVVHEHLTSSIGDVLVHAMDGDKLILAFVGHAAIYDTLRLSGDVKLTPSQMNLLIERNLTEVFAPIISAKYERGAVGVYAGPANLKYPRVDVTYEDIAGSGKRISADVLKLDAHFASVR